MTASHAADLASRFARTLVAKLKAINEAHPTAHLSSSNQKILEKISGGKPLGPTPSELAPVFERLFFAHIASRYVIVPDEITLIHPSPSRLDRSHP